MVSALLIMGALAGCSAPTVEPAPSVAQEPPVVEVKSLIPRPSAEQQIILLDGLEAIDSRMVTLWGADKAVGRARDVCHVFDPADSPEVRAKAVTDRFIFGPEPQRLTAEQGTQVHKLILDSFCLDPLG